MSFSSRVVGWVANLPAAETRDVVVVRDIEVPMPDGTVLFADRYHPREGGNRPILLVRTPYGRSGLWGLFYGRTFAERGFQVLIQSCRGTFGSGGKFEPFHNERADGLATLAWLEKQAWFSGAVATCGPSYLGFVQWAVAAEAGPALKAMSTHVTSSEFRSPTYSGESFWLDTALTWISIVDSQEKAPLQLIAASLRAVARVRAAARHVPLRTADEAAIGKVVPFYREWLAHDQPGDAYWKPIDFSDQVSRVTAPVHQVGGWYDVFLPQTFADYARLRQGGQEPYLTVGPWTHTSPALMPATLRESVAWFRAHLLGDRSGLRKTAVKLFVMGANEWKEFQEWPPAGYRPTRFHLHAGGGLATEAPSASEPDHYRYDPADPTPAVGGTSLSENSGPRDNEALEARKDVLVYSTPPLSRDVEVIGPVVAELYVTSSLEHTDFFVRLCDVGASRKSVNVCDGLVRLSPGQCPPDAGGCRKVTVELWPTAHRFKRGHRIRVQVSSGAHPRFTRNPGSGEPLGGAVRLLAAEQSVHHDPAHPSAILLPIEG